MKYIFFLLYGAFTLQLTSQTDTEVIRNIYSYSLSNGQSYQWLDHLSNQIGSRLSGSLGAERAVAYTKEELEKDYEFNWTLFTENLGKKTPFPGEFWVGKHRYKSPPKKVIVSSLNALKCTVELLKKNWSTKQWKTYSSCLTITFHQKIFPPTEYIEESQGRSIQELTDTGRDLFHLNQGMLQ